VGAGCEIGARAVLSDFVELLPGTVVPPDGFFPERAIVGGSPARVVGIAGDGVEEVRRERVKEEFKDFQYRLEKEQREEQSEAPP
jgi:hypothetical protein